MCEWDKGPILMSAENPTGLKLEDCLAMLRYEISIKTAKIINDTSPQAQLVVRNNQTIIGLIGQAEGLQCASMHVLDSMKLNEGPTGTPRIGDALKTEGAK